MSALSPVCPNCRALFPFKTQGALPVKTKRIGSCVLVVATFFLMVLYENANAQQKSAKDQLVGDMGARGRHQ